MVILTLRSSEWIAAMKQKNFKKPDLHSIKASTAQSPLFALARFLGRVAARKWLAEAKVRHLEVRHILTGGALGSLFEQPGNRFTGGALGQLRI